MQREDERAGGGDADADTAEAPADQLLPCARRPVSSAVAAIMKISALAAPATNRSTIHAGPVENNGMTARVATTNSEAQTQGGPGAHQGGRGDPGDGSGEVSRVVRGGHVGPELRAESGLGVHERQDRRVDESSDAHADGHGRAGGHDDL